MTYKTLHRKITIKQHEPHYMSKIELRCSERVSSSCSTCGTVVFILLHIRFLVLWSSKRGSGSTMYDIYINVRENRRSNQKWTIRIHRPHWAQDTQRGQTKQKHKDLTAKSKQLLFLIWHPLCYSNIGKSGREERKTKYI